MSKEHPCRQDDNPHATLYAVVLMARWWWSGKEEALLPLPPLRTVRESFHLILLKPQTKPLSEPVSQLSISG